VFPLCTTASGSGARFNFLLVVLVSLVHSSTTSRIEVITSLSVSELEVQEPH